MSGKIPIIAITGPTGSGKTKLSIEIAKMLDGEIISVDSIQTYKDAAIMSGAATNEEMQGVPHHFINVFDATDEITNFVPLVIHTVKSIHAAGRLPILCGGSLSLTGPILFDHFIAGQNLFVITLHGTKENLAKLSDSRIEQMIEEGIQGEVEHLYALEKLHHLEIEELCKRGAWKAIGYAELRPSCLVDSPEDKCAVFQTGIESMKSNTRAYAAMQLTYLNSKLIPALAKQQTYLRVLVVVDKKSFAHRVVGPALEACNTWIGATQPADKKFLPEEVSTASTVIVGSASRNLV